MYYTHITVYSPYTVIAVTRHTTYSHMASILKLEKEARNQLLAGGGLANYRGYYDTSLSDNCGPKRRNVDPIAGSST